MFTLNPIHAIDFYKADHRSQYPIGTEYVYSNFTPRSDKIFTRNWEWFEGKVVAFGFAAVVRHFLIDMFGNNFFSQPLDKVLAAYKRRMDTSLGPGAITLDHIRDLHQLGYLPIRVKAVPEGSRVNIGVPVLTVINTLPEFFWLTNYLESVLSAYLWKPMTSATIAYEYRRMLESYCELTGVDFLPIQAHDFSFRGLSGLEDAAFSGMGHLTSFIGTDTVPAIDAIEYFYNAAAGSGVSVPATEHSVACLNIEEVENSIREKGHWGSYELSTYKELFDL